LIGTILASLDLSNKELLEIMKKGKTLLCEIAEHAIPKRLKERLKLSARRRALAVCSKEKRHGLIRVKLNSRSKMPSFGSKKEFVLGLYY
jgi:hypothetical protein